MFQTSYLSSFSTTIFLYSGQGANQALLDAVLLARHIYDEYRNTQTGSHQSGNIKIGLEERLAKFEFDMLKRSAGKVKASAEAAKFLHSEVAIMEGNVTRGRCNQDSTSVGK